MENTTEENMNPAQERTAVESLLYCLSYLLRHKFLIISLTILAAAGSVGFAVLSLWLPPEKSPLPNYYRAYAVLIVSQGSPGNMTAMLAALGIQAPLGRNEMNYGELGIRVIRSRPFIDEIIRKHNIIERHEIKEREKSLSRQIVHNSTEIIYEPRTGTMQISYEDIDPVFARDVVESMVLGLQLWFDNWDGTISQQQLREMEKKIDEVSREIDRLEDEITEFQTRYGVLSISQLAESQSSMISALQQQLIQVEMAIRNYSGFANIEDQELIQLQSQRESLLALIRQIDQGQSTGGVRQMPSRDELPTLAIEYSHMRMNHEIQMRIFQNLKEQYELQRLTSTGTSAFSLLEPAEIPDEKSGPSRGQLCIFITLAGFMMSIGFAVLIDFTRNIKKDPKKMSILKGDHEKQ